MAGWRWGHSRIKTLLCQKAGVNRLVWCGGRATGDGIGEIRASSIRLHFILKAWRDCRICVFLSYGSNYGYGMGFRKITQMAAEEQIWDFGRPHHWAWGSTQWGWCWVATSTILTGWVWWKGKKAKQHRSDHLPHLQTQAEVEEVHGWVSLSWRRQKDKEQGAWMAGWSCTLTFSWEGECGASMGPTGWEARRMKNCRLQWVQREGSVSSRWGQ